MKGFVIFAVFSILYVLLVLVFHGIAGAEFTPEGADEFLNAGVKVPIPNMRQNQQGGPPNGTGNPIVDLFHIEDPYTKKMMDAAYGSYHGDDQCIRKSACILGNYMKDLPGRNLMFILLGGYIPPEYSLFYDIFRNSALYGQNCDVYVCIAQNQGQVKSPPLQ